MASNPIITLSPKWISRSEIYGHDVVAQYRARNNLASLAFSSHDAENDPVLQAHARMAEIALCVWAGIDPLQELNWSGRCDDGWDVKVSDTRFDVKATGPRSQYLIWPIRKNSIFASKRFDSLALVRGEAARFEIAGHIPKALFATEHRVADEAHVLDTGTWYMHQSELWTFPFLP